MFWDLIQVGGWLAKSILQQSPSAASVLSNPPYRSRPACSNNKRSRVKQLISVCVHSHSLEGLFWQILNAFNLCLSSLHHCHRLPTPPPWHRIHLKKASLSKQKYREWKQISEKQARNLRRCALKAAKLQHAKLIGICIWSNRHVYRALWVLHHINGYAFRPKIRKYREDKPMKQKINKSTYSECD